MLKKHLILSLIILFIPVYALHASVLETLAKEGVKAMDAVLKSHGIPVKNGDQIKLSLELSLSNLNGGTFPATKNELAKILNQNELKPLRKIMQKDLNNLTQEEIAELVKLTAKAAVESGKGKTALACSSCVDDALKKASIDLIAVEIKVQSVVKEMQKITVKNPGELNNLIKKSAMNLGLKGAALNQLIGATSDSEKKQLIAVLRLMKGGVGEQKEFGQALKKFNTVGDNNLMGKNQLWNIITMLEPHDLAPWTKKLNELAIQTPLNPSDGRISNLRQHMIQKADDAAKGGDYRLKENLQKMREKNCWGIF